MIDGVVSVVDHEYVVNPDPAFRIVELKTCIVSGPRDTVGGALMIAWTGIKLLGQTPFVA